MESVNEILDGLRSLWPAGVTFVIVILVAMVARFFFERRHSGSLNMKFRRQVVTILLASVGLLAIIMVLPLGDERRGQLLSLIGILLSAAIALSSTTVLGNAMAGFMLREK